MKECTVFATFVTGIVISILHITDVLHMSWSHLHYNIAVIVFTWVISLLFCLRK